MNDIELLHNMQKRCKLIEEMGINADNDHMENANHIIKVGMNYMISGAFQKKPTLQEWNKLVEYMKEAIFS